MHESGVHGSLNIMLLKNAVAPEDGTGRFLAPLQDTAQRLAAALAEHEGVSLLETPFRFR